MDWLKEAFTIKDICNVLKISKQSYFDWVKRERPGLRNWNRDLANKIFSLCNENRFYGYTRITHLLLRRFQININRKTTYRYMKAMSLQAISRDLKQFKYPKMRNDNNDYKNLMLDESNNRNFKVDKSNRYWFIDITYLLSRKTPFYLFAIKDGYDKRIVAYSLTDRFTNEFVIDCIRKAFIANDVSNLIIHSDHGTNFTSYEYEDLCKEFGVTISMSRKGNSVDNSPIESFFALLKHELLYKKIKNKLSILQTKVLIENFIKYYNNERIQLTLNGHTPFEVCQVGTEIISTLYLESSKLG